MNKSSSQSVAQPMSSVSLPSGPRRLQRKCDCGSGTNGAATCPKCLEEEHRKLQRKGASSRDVREIPSIVNDVLGSPGQPLATGTREKMEQRFAHDFSRVRVHTDALSAKSAAAIDAHAYTVGNDVVFGRSQFAPGTHAGDHLIAHELTHVVQQRHAPTLQTSGLDAPGDPSEREADLVADQVMRGEPANIQSLSSSNSVQRKMRNSVVTDFQPNPKMAKACIVHIHGEEQNALAVANEMRKRRCVNLVHLDTKERWITFDVQVGKETHVCKADPNRIFSDNGRETAAINTCTLSGGNGKETSSIRSVKDAAKLELKNFADGNFGLKIGECRGGGSSPLDGELPVVALHNNEGLSPDAKVAEKGARLPSDPADPTKKLPNPSRNDPAHPHDFMLTTQSDDFLKLRDKRNVILQENPIQKGNEDGSLSVALKDSHYINVEKEGRQHKLVAKGSFKSNTITYIENFALAAEALDAVGVPDGICSATDQVLSPANPAADALDKLNDDSKPMPDKSEEKLPDQPKAESPKTEDQKAGDPKALDRDSAPSAPPKGCQSFADQSALDTRKSEWAGRLAKLPMREIINWIIGGPSNALMGDATKEVDAQQNCLIDTMRSSATASGRSIPKGNIVKSELRSFDDQRSIWTRKFAFRGASFDRISDVARTKFGTLIDPKEIKWDPSNKNHQICWGVKKPPKGVQVTPLTGEEKEKEILMASSAPGVSRHHAGTDFDFGRTGDDLEPEAWTGKGDFADAYAWLARNASTWGFFQPFNTKGGYGKGYMAERWHWSYYPIAQALFEFAIAHQQEIEAELLQQWSDKKGNVKDEFKFIAGHWRDYLTNVETKGRF